MQFNRIDRVDVTLQRAGLAEPQNFLIVGSDTRAIEDSGPDAAGIFGKKGSGDEPPSGQRADTIVVARVDPTRTTVELLSLPRDLYVTNAVTGKKGKINAAYNGGAQQLVDTVAKNLDIPINHYVEVNFQSFKGLVDAIGGVDLYFDRPVRDRNTGLNIGKKGCYTLDGVGALAFARSRHLVYSNGSKWVSDPTADMGRITRQQIFLRHAMAKASTLGLSDVNTVRKLVGVAVDNVKIDDSLSADDLIALARKFSKFDARTMVTHRLVTTPDSTSGGESILRFDRSSNSNVLGVFDGSAPSDAPTDAPPTTALARSSVTLDVLNASGVPGEAKRVASALEATGFVTGEIGNALPGKKSVVKYAIDSKLGAELVASAMSPSPVLELDETLGTNKVVLIVAGDHGGVTPVATTPTSASGTAAVDPAATSSAAPTTTIDPADEAIGLQIGDPPPGIACG